MLARPQNMKIETAIDMAVSKLRRRLRRRLLRMSHRNFTIAVSVRQFIFENNGQLPARLICRKEKIFFASHVASPYLSDLWQSNIARWEKRGCASACLDWADRKSAIRTLRSGRSTRFCTLRSTREST